MDSRTRALLVPALAAVLLSGCAATAVTSPFSTSGPVWPESPRQVRIAFIGEFSTPDDLAISPSFWERVANVTAGKEDNSMLRPMAVAATSDGRVILVADPDARCVHRYDLRRRNYRCLRSKESPDAFRPVGLAMIDDERMVVSDSRQGRLFQGALGDSELKPYEVSAPLVQPTGLAWSSASQRLFLTDTGAQSVLEFDRQGNLVRSIGRRGSGPGQFNFPTYLWVSYDNELLVTDSLNFRLQRFDTTGKFLFQFGENGDRPGDFSRPKGVATDVFDHIYVVDALMHVLQIFNTDGELLLSIGTQGQGPGEFWLPNGIFVTRENTIFVADTFNGRVQVFRYVGPES